MTILVASAMIKPLLEARLPGWVEPRWFGSTREMWELAPEAEIGWLDTYKKPDMAEGVRRAAKLKWLNSIYAGVDGVPLEILAERGVVFTNGVGINAVTIAEYAVMGMLTTAKGYREVVAAQQRREWLLDSPGKVELAGSKALIIGYGAIGQLIDARLAAFDVAVTKVRRTPGEGVLAPDQWRGRLGDFDWIILAVPSTEDTRRMIGAAELAAMKPAAVILNIARGAVIDQPALVEALREKRIGGAFLDVTSPEPLPPEHELWDLPNAHITMHLSGRAQDRMFHRAADRFLANLVRFKRGEPVEPRVNLALGY